MLYPTPHRTPLGKMSQNEIRVRVFVLKQPGTASEKDRGRIVSQSCCTASLACIGDSTPGVSCTRGLFAHSPTQPRKLACAVSALFPGADGAPPGPAFFAQTGSKKFATRKSGKNVDLANPNWLAGRPRAHASGDCSHKLLAARRGSSAPRPCARGAARALFRARRHYEERARGHYFGAF